MNIVLLVVGRYLVQQNSKQFCSQVYQNDVCVIWRLKSEIQ